MLSTVKRDTARLEAAFEREQEQRKPYARKPFEEPDTGLGIGQGRSEAELKEEKRRKQLAYRQMLEDSHNATPVASSRAVYHRTRLEQDMKDEEFCIGNHINKARNDEEKAAQYKADCERDLRIRRQQKLQQEKFDKMTCDGLLIGHNPEKENKRKPNHYGESDIFNNKAKAALPDMNIDIKKVNESSRKPAKMAPFAYGYEEVLDQPKAHQRQTEINVTPDEFFIGSEDKNTKRNKKLNAMNYCEQLRCDMSKKKLVDRQAEVEANRRALDRYD